MIRSIRSPENLIGGHQSSSTTIPGDNLALGSLHQSMSNIVSSTAFKDAQQLYFRSFDF